MTLIVCPPYVEPEGDPYFEKVRAFLRFNELPLIDSSTYKNTVSASQIILNTDDPENPCGSFNGTSSYLTLGTAPGRFGQDDLTIEGFFTPRNQLSNFPCIFGNYTTWGTNNGGIALFAGHVSSGRSTYSVALNGSFPALRSTSVITAGVRVHIALVRHGTSMLLFIGGKLEHTLAIPSNTLFDGNGNMSIIGSAGDSIAQGFLNGLLDDVRISRALARYTQDFIPPQRLLA